MSWILILGLILIISYLVNKYLFSYWDRKHVPQLEPSFLFGNIAPMLTLRQSLGELFTNFYMKHKHKKFIGAYLTYKPMLIVNDPELFNEVMIKEFTTFHDRPTPGDAAETYPLVGNLFNLRGQKWRDLRVKLSPTFTSGKIKLMFPIMRDCGNVLTAYIEKNIKNGNKTFDFKELFGRLTINNISSIAFGVENDCINDPDNIFRKIGMKIFEPTVRNGLINALAFMTPDLFTKLKINPFLPEIENFVYSVVNQTIDFREKSNFFRNDFMQLLIELKNKGFITADKNLKEDEVAELKDNNSKLQKMTIDEIAAQAFIFFGAGFETSSSLMTFCLYALCRNKDIQSKVQDEIDRVMKKAGPEGITYDLLNEMKYLDCCIDETLRIYPILPVLFRISSKDHKLTGTNFVLEKGTPVFIPLMGIQRDPDIYEDPLAFKPERFLNSSTGSPKVSGLTYAPFGDGPRNCIGARLGKIQAKLGLAIILHKFQFDFHDEAMRHEEIKYHPNSLVLSPAKQMNMDASLRN